MESIALMIITPPNAMMIAITEYLRFFLAVSASFSSPAAMRYWKPDTMNAIKAKMPKISKSVEANPAIISTTGRSDNPPVALEVGTQTPAIF